MGIIILHTLLYNYWPLLRLLHWSINLR